MASYFVACHAQPDGSHAVHDRSRCPPGRFPAEPASEYLGEFLAPSQAFAVARLRYAQVRGCSCCDPLFASRAQPALAGALTSLRT